MTRFGLSCIDRGTRGFYEPPRTWHLQNAWRKITKVLRKMDKVRIVKRNKRTENPKV